MKKLVFAAAMLFCCLSFKFADAQIHFSVGINIGSQPGWGPVGYSHADYYYIPDIDVYYDVAAHQYIYLENNRWIHSYYLPVRYRNYDLYHGYKVVLNERNPWLHDEIYRNRYARYKGRHDQTAIYFSHDPKYRNHYQDKRAQELNAREHHEDVRAHNEAVKARDEKARAQHLDQRAQHLNKKEKQINQEKKKDDKHQDDHH